MPVAIGPTLSDLSADPRHERLGAPALPDWVQAFRDHQVEAVDRVLAKFDEGFKVVLLEANTGSGKTLIAETVRRLGGFRRAAYVCTTKGLQDQFMADYPYAHLLKGRANYPTLDHPEAFDQKFDRTTCGDCNAAYIVLPAPDCSGCDRKDTASEKPVPHCPHCHPVDQCPYRVAKRTAVDGELSVLNTAYFLAEANGPGEFAEARPGRAEGRRDLVIMDECDTLESVLMGEVEVTVGRKLRERYGLGLPERKTERGAWIRKEAAWLEWVTEQAIPTLKPRAQTIAKNVAAQAAMGLAADRTLKREGDSLANLVVRLERLAIDLREQLAEEDAGLERDVRWVTDNEALKAGHAVFRPVRVARYAPGKVWRHGHRWLAMSASIVDPVEWTSSLGVAEHEWAIVKVDYAFPAERRPVHIVPVANMTYKERETAWPEMAKGVLRVMLKHPDDRVLVHTVSYKLAEFLRDWLGKYPPFVADRLVVYRDEPEARDRALDRFKELANGVCLAPSFDRGVDLPDDLCRVQVIAKIPFPNIGDPQVEERTHSRGGQQWYQVQTVRAMIQMTGRGMRHEGDQVTSYILDAQFQKNVYYKSRMLLPKWWRDSVNFEGGVL